MVKYGVFRHPGSKGVSSTSSIPKVSTNTADRRKLLDKPSPLKKKLKYRNSNKCDEDKLIIVQGSGIQSANELWDEVLDSFDIPKVIEKYEEDEKSVGSSPAPASSAMSNRLLRIGVSQTVIRGHPFRR